jgi:hypothetical protein
MSQMILAFLAVWVLSSNIMKEEILWTLACFLHVGSIV